MPSSLSRLSFVQQDVADNLGHVFLEHWVDSVVHLACPSGLPGRGSESELSPWPESPHPPLRVLEKLLSACHRSGVHRLILVSCAYDVGPVSRMRTPLREEDPPPTFAPSPQDQLELDRCCAAFTHEHPEMRIIRLRMAPLLGPGAGGPLARALAQPLLLVRAPAAPLQVCHIDDAVRAIHALLHSDEAGVFHLGPDDAVSPRELGKLLRRVCVPLPHSAVHLGQRLVERISQPVRMRLQAHLPTLLPEAPRLASSRMRSRLNFEFRFSSRQAVAAFAQHARSSAGASPFT